jgi:predicted small lipoprotein YifL
MSRAGFVATATLAALAACGTPGPPPGSPEALVAHLGAVVGADEATRQREVASWQIDAALWDRTVVATYRPLHADYQRAFTAEAPVLVARLAHGGAITARRHYAGDPRLTLPQGRDRWALPPLFPSLVAEAGGAPIDAVFVPDGPRWRALVGLDAVVRARVTALAPGCAANLARAGGTGRCSEVGAAIADAALRTDRDQLAHVCRLAETLCGKGSP